MHPAALDVFSGEPNIDVRRLQYDAPRPDNLDALREAHGYQISAGVELQNGWRGDAQLFKQCPNLLAISSTGSGYDTINVAEATECGIAVCNQAGSNAQSVAEHALGFMLSLSQRITRYNRAMKRERISNRFADPGMELFGKTLGIVGMGNIGMRLAAICGGALKMNILAYDPNLTADEISRRGGQKVTLEALLRASDFVSLHCPLTSESRGMIGAEEFAMMRPDAYFVTTARGGIHDEVALLKALVAGGLAGAGLDVFAEEPPPKDHPLLALDNVIATPHVAGLSIDALKAMAVGAAEQWKIIFAGKRPPRLVNPEVWPHYAERYARIVGKPPERELL